jgi:hypothetical protein
MPRISHPLAQGQLNNILTRPIIGVSLKVKARNPMETHMILNSII